MSEKKEKSEENALNIIYVGKRQKLNKDTGKYETVAKEVPAFIIDGPDKISLPEGIEKGIAVEPDLAARLFALRPDDFKIPTEKGFRAQVEKVVETPLIAPTQQKTDTKKK
jgi:hypothetical protein